MQKYKIDAIALSDRLLQINKNYCDYIMNKGGKDNIVQDMYEYINIQIDFAKVVASAKKYYEINGYPSIRKNGEETVATNFDIVYFDKAISNANSKLITLRQLSGIGNPKSDDYMKNDAVLDFLATLASTSQVGDYIVNEDKEIDRIKKTLLCDIIKISKSICDKKLTLSDYTSSEFSSISNLKEMYNEYIDLVGNEVVLTKADGTTYYGAQFGEQIKNLIKAIEIGNIYNPDNIKKYKKKYIRKIKSL